MDSNTDMMKVFENHKFGQVRILLLENTPWFVLADICKALEIGNPSQAMTRLDEDEKMTLTLNEGHSGQRGGAQMVNVVNEPGLYTLVLRSRKAEAKQFKRWITHEVLPSIRKHGAYMTDSVLEQVIENPDTIYSLAAQLLEDKARCEELSKQLKDAKPKAEYFDSFIRADGCICIRYCGKEFGIPQNAFVKLMLEHKYLYRDQKNRLMPFADKEARGFFIVRDFYTPGGVLGQQTLVTCKGKEHIRRQLKKWGIIA